MKMDVKLRIVVIFGYIIGCYSTDRHSKFKVTLYTDLVDMIGKNDSCLIKQEAYNSTTDEENLYAKRGIILSDYDFNDVNKLDAVIGKCDVIDINVPYFYKYTWTCFSTSNSSSRDLPIWFFVDCQQSQVVSVECLNARELRILIEHLCEKRVFNRRCTIFAYQDGKSAICSKKFKVKSLRIPATNLPESNIDLKDTIAYLCVAFILTTFLITVLIPANKCKPTYIYDREQALRVPLEIYEMYGVSYQPSAKKKLNRKSVNMEVIPAISSHMRNVAAVANNPVDWKGYKTKFKFQHGQPLFHGLSIETLDRLIKGTNGNYMNFIAKHNDRDRNRASIISNVGVGTFDYTLFNNENEENNDKSILKSSGQAESGSSLDNSKRSNKSCAGSTKCKHDNEEEENKGFDTGKYRTHNKVPLHVNFAEEEHQSFFQNTGENDNFQPCQCDHIHSASSIYSDKPYIEIDNEHQRNEAEKHEVIDNDIVIAGSRDKEIDDNDQSFLLPIYEDTEEHGSCICNHIEPIDSLQNENKV